jgi:lipoprotein-anchoring transpeptidase ErfK/SrfK
MTGYLDRRAVLTGLGLLLGGCAAPRLASSPGGFRGGGDPALFVAYGPITDHGHAIPGLDPATINPDVLRQQVPFSGPYRPGTIVVAIPERHLYLVQPGGTAMRYTVGVGREEALNFRGSAVIGRKAEWPHWTPTPTMMATMPRYRAYAKGMEGGIGNPLGARALYLYRDGKDTYFRLHGTNEPETIGSAVSSGCIRLFNHDIIDLYNRVPVGTTVVVLQEEGEIASAQPMGAYGGAPGPDPYSPAPEVMYGPGSEYGAGYYGGDTSVLQAGPYDYGPGY